MKKFLIISILFLLVAHAYFSVGSLAQEKKMPDNLAVRSKECASAAVYSSTSKEEVSGSSYTEYSDSLSKERSAYHKYLNKRFEINVSILSYLLSRATEVDQKGVDSILREKSLSTWQLASTLICSYEKYAKYVDYFSNPNTVPADASEQGKAAAELIKATQDSITDWKKELQDSKKALDIALATYDQYTSAFSLHLKNREVIKELALYREQFGYLRSLMSCLPSKFVNQSTTKCE